jgi:hypothetical protein
MLSDLLIETLAQHRQLAVAEAAKAAATDKSV